MASTFFTLLDDIATLLDDVAVMTKAATKKTIGVVREDVAITASKTAGLNPRRQIAVIAEIAKRSLYNKAKVIPAVLAVSAAAPALVTPLLLSCAAYICFEGFHKVLKKAGGKDHSLAKCMNDAKDEAALLKLEKEKIDGAVRTDLILSAEIAILSLAGAAHLSIAAQAAFLAMVGIGVTAAVYSTVAAILAVDGLAVRLARSEVAGGYGNVQRRIGNVLLAGAPLVMRTISFLGVGAMFYLGGSILLSALPGAQAALGAFTAGSGAQGLISFGASVAAGFAAGVAGKILNTALTVSGISAFGRETGEAVVLGTAIMTGHHDRSANLAVSQSPKPSEPAVPDLKQAINDAAQDEAPEKAQENQGAAAMPRRQMPSPS